MLLNGAGLNRAGLNGPASIPLVQATGAWTGGLTFAGTPTHQQAGSANILCGMTVTFGADRIIPATVNWSIEGTNFFRATLSHIGNGAWTIGATWQAYIVREVDAAAGFEATGTFTAIPDAVFGEGAWSLGATTALVPLLSGAISGSWASSATFSGDALATRMVEGSWEGSGSLWSESTLEVGGVVYHEGYSFWEGTGEWENAPHLTATFINGSFQQNSADFDISAYAIRAANATWQLAPVFTISAQNTKTTSVSMVNGASLQITGNTTGLPLLALSGSAALTAGGRINHATRGTWAGAVVFSGEPKLKGAMRGAMTVDGTLGMTGTRGVKPTLTLVPTIQLSVTGLRTVFATGSWSGNGSALAAGATRAGSPAPPERQFTITGTPRVFAVPVSSRNFKVAA